MKQNRICFLAAAAAVLLGTAACNKVKEKEFDPNDPAIYTVTVQPDGSVFQAEGEEFVFNFNAPDYWFVSSPVDWLEFEPESGKPGDVTLTVRAKQNIKGERSALVTVNAKKQRGKFSVSQEAWPYYHEWAVYGTIGGGASDQDLSMEDQGDQLVWKRGGIPFHFGEAFQFRMTGSDAAILGLDGALTPVEGTNAYTGALVKGGEKVTLPVEGYWDVTLDVEHWTMTAELTGRYPWTLVGTVNGGSWDQDFDLADMGGQMTWEATRVPFHNGEAFKFRREKNNAVNLGIDGEFAPVEGAENQYVAKLKQDGETIALPAEGYWTLRLDVNASTLTATLTEEFPRIHAGVFWENDDPEGHGSINWNSTYRFGLEGHDGNNECITTLPEEVWNKLKTEPFYVVLKGENPQIRVTTGWWSGQWGNDATPGDERLKDNGDGTWTLRVDLSDAPDFVANLDQQHFLLTGDRYTPLGIYPENAWANDGTTGAVSWNSTYRFGLEGHDGNNECITTFPETIWNKLKTETFYVDVEATNPQIRVTSGWWSGQWGNDATPGDERLKDNGDGTFTLTVNLSGDPLVDLLDQQHFLVTGDRFTPLRIRFQW